MSSTMTRAPVAHDPPTAPVMSVPVAPSPARDGPHPVERTPPSTDRRMALAKAIVGVAQSAITDPTALAIVLDEGHEDGRPSGTTTAAATVIIRSPDALGRSLFPPTSDAFAEGFLRGDLDIEGDIVAAIEAAPFDLRRLRPEDLRRVARWGWELWRGTPKARPLERVAQISGRRHSRARDQAAIRFHYDVGDTFYRLWLDRRMTYTCAWFPEGTTTQGAAERLDAAQEMKLDLIAGKLGLTAEHRVLDIGSGWGSLVNHIGERYGCEAVGVTLSETQADEANVRAAAMGLGERVRSEVRDYRDLAPLGEFDRVASVGMFEHVGSANLPTYFRAAFDALRPGGLFLNHGLASSRGRGNRLRPDSRAAASRFLQRYVFPDGELVPIEEAVRLARAAGFEVLDVQSLRPHYALTLAAWVARLERKWTAAVEAAGEEVARTWRLYMSASRLGFEVGDLDVCQMLLAKPADGRPARLPLRPWWWSDRRVVAMPISNGAGPSRDAPERAGWDTALG
jgi:cyclopropane-fatty-acyl-phospholipid synthase